jgi:heparan-alpha-glucosaminide N-acetyltransferase
VKRIYSIDVFRALTMCLMIFVNDLFTVQGVPAWLLHTEMNQDGMGFSDLIFPIFLVIVGMSTPFALGLSGMKWRHVLERSFALVLMGFLLVNYENMPRGNFRAIMGMELVLSFFLIWSVGAKFWVQAAGWVGIAVFVISYPGTLQAHWWGILGLIGWSYLLSAGVYLLSRGRAWVLVGFTLGFLVLSVAEHAGLLGVFAPVRKSLWIVESGALPFLCMLGILASVFYAPTRRYMLMLVLVGTALIGLGFLLRPIGGISKILATPAWVCICGGITYCTYAVLVFVVDSLERRSWADFIRPAGVATLTCYLLPYFWYGMRALSGAKLPDSLGTAPLGVVLSMGVSLLLIYLTGLLVKRGIKLKV